MLISIIKKKEREKEKEKSIKVKIQKGIKKFKLKVITKERESGKDDRNQSDRNIKTLDTCIQTKKYLNTSKTSKCHDPSFRKKSINLTKKLFNHKDTEKSLNKKTV